MNVLTSHAILQSVRDTAIRFAGSEEGGKEWRAILTEISSHLPRWSITLKSQLDPHEGFTIGGDLRFAGDRGDTTGAPRGLQRGVGARRPGLREIGEDGNFRNVYEWFIERDPETRYGFRSRQCAWFIERLRILGFTSIRSEFLQAANDLHDDSVVEGDFLVGGNALRGTREAFEQSEMTWATLVEFLQFVIEKSDWTTPLMPPYDSDECPFDDPESISNIRDAQQRSYGNRINWCYRQILEESGVIDTTGFHAPSLVPNSWDPIAAIHELFNQEQGETLDFEAFLQHAQNLINTNPPTEAVVETPVEDIQAKKKRQLAEILSILEEKAEKSEIGEGNYKEYSELLMSFHKTL